jgi:hypothetical protein
VLAGIPWECDQLAHHHNAELRKHVEACDGGEVEEPCDRDTERPVHLCEVGRFVADRTTRGDRLVYSTVPLLQDGEPHDRYRPLTDFRQLVTVEHADVIFDEVAGVSDAADSSAMPVQVTNWLHQLRKRDVRLRVTTPAYARCSKPIRQVAQLVVDARSFFPERATSGRMWRPRRGMLFRCFDSFEFEDYTSSTAERIKSQGNAVFWRPGSLAERSYSTIGAVQALGHVTEGGMCGVCGGSRSRPACACGHDVDDVPMRELRVVETVGSSGRRIRKAERVVPDDPDLVRDATLQDLLSGGDVRFARDFPAGTKFVD